MYLPFTFKVLLVFMMRCGRETRRERRKKIRKQQQEIEERERKKHDRVANETNDLLDETYKLMVVNCVFRIQS